MLAQALARYPSVRIVIADSAYDREGLLEWLLVDWWVGLDCVGHAEGRGFVVLPRRWLVERRFAGLLGCRRLSRCYDGVCEVEEAWLWMASARWLMRRIARNLS